MFSITKPRVPEGLRDLMKDLTREILKEKPTDIYNFAEYYFLSRLPEKEHYNVKKFEDNSGKYDFSYIKNSQRYQIPAALVYSIIPESLTNLIKDLIKAILREQPENLCDFAVEYFRHLKVTMKSVNPTENIAKEINYSAYENYFNNKERFLLTPYVKCKCGRILGESDDSNYNDIQNDVKKDKNKGQRISERDFTFTEKYLNSVILIQRYFRRYLKTRNAKTNTNEKLKYSAITEQLNQTSNQSKIVIPQLHLNQVETENFSEDASYTSQSTALLSASESGRDNSDLSTTESIPAKTIIEREEIENNEKNFPTDLKRIVSIGTTHQSRSNETTDNDSKSTLNDKKLNTGEGDAHKRTGVQSNNPRNLNIIREIKREKSIEDNIKEPSEIEHFLSNNDINEYAVNSSVTDGSGSFFEDHKEINSKLFEAKPVVATKIYSNEGENNQNEIINASLQTKENNLESMQKVSIAENMNADNENIRKTSDRQQENSSIETNVILSESEAVEIQHESNKPQIHTNNSDKNFEIKLENKIFANENVNDNGSLEKNLQNLPTNISSDHITNSDVSTEEEKLLKKYSKEKNAECINNDLNDVHVDGGYSGLSTEKDLNFMVKMTKNSTLNTDGPNNKNDPVNEHNPNNLKSDRESIQHVLTLPVNEQNIQTADVTTDKILCDESKNIVDFNPNHEKSEYIDTNKESGILGENQNNLSMLHEQDTTSPIINDEENNTNNDNTREKNSNILNKVKSNDNYSDKYSELSSDREIEINTISKARKSEINFPNVNKNDNDLNSSEIFLKGDNIITNIENDLDNSTDSEKLKVLENLKMKEETENGFAKPKTELYETDIIDKPEADMTVERTLGKNEMESVIIEDEIDRKLEDTFDDRKVDFEIPLMGDRMHKQSIDLNKYKKFDSGVCILQKDFGESKENKANKDAVLNESHTQHSCKTDEKCNETNCNQDSTDAEKYKLKTALKSPKGNNIIDLEKGQEIDKIITKRNDKSVLITKNNIETKNESIQHESPYTSFDEPKPTDNLMSKKIKGETENDRFLKIAEKKHDNKSEENQETLSQNNDIKEEVSIKKHQNNSNSLPASLNTEIYSKQTLENYKCQDDNAVDDTVANDILNKNVSTISLKKVKEDQNDANKSKQNLNQNIVMEKEGGASEINKHDLKESINEMINYENIKNDTTDNIKSEINCGGTSEIQHVKYLASTEKYVMNDTIPHDNVADEQIYTALQINCKEDQSDESKPEQSINHIIVTEERKSYEEENQSDEKKLDENRDMEKEGMTIEMINCENTTSDITDDQIITPQTNPSNENNPEQRIHLNEKESQSDENKSDQNQDIEKEGSTAEKKNCENIRSDVSDNSETGQKFKLYVVESAESDTISDNILAGDQSNTPLQTEPEQSIDQNIEMEERKSNEKESKSDGNKSEQNQDIEKEGTTTDNIRTDVSYNSETGQKFKLNVVDSVENDTKSGNIIPDDQSNTTLQAGPSGGNKPEQSIDQNIAMEERKSNEKESKRNQNKSSQNHDIEKEGTTSKKIDSENLRSGVSDNSETEQKFKLNVGDSIGNDTISDNIIPDDQSNTTLQTRPSEESKPEDIVTEERKSNEEENQSDEKKLDENRDMEKEGMTIEMINCENTKSDVTDDQIITPQTNPSNENNPEQRIHLNEKESQSDENKSGQNQDIEKEGATAETKNSENIRSDVSDNSETGQKFKLNVVDSVGNGTISDNITAGDQCNTILQTRPSEENKSEQSIDQNIEMEERKSGEKESQSDENKSGQNQDIEKEGSTAEKKNSENIRSDVSDNSETGQKFKLNVVDSIGNDILNDTISINITADDQTSTNLSDENKPEQSIDQNEEDDENNSNQNLDIEKEGTTSKKIDSENLRSGVSNNSETGQKFKINVDDSNGNDTISDNIIAGDQSNTTLQTNPSEENNPEQSIDPNIDMEKAKKLKEKQNDPNDTTTDATDNLKIKIKSDENREDTNDVDSPENYILNKTILDNISADGHTTPIPPNNDRNLNNNIDMNEENITRINRNDSKESEIKKITSEDTRPEFTDNVKIERSSGDNLLEENFDKNIHMNETFTTGANDEKINFEDFRSEATDNLKLKRDSDITSDENTVESVGNNDLKNTISNKTIVEKINGTPEKTNKKEFEKSTEQQENIDQNIEMKREKRETTPINRTASNESINEKTNSESDCIETTDNLKCEICSENVSLNKTLSDTIITDNQVNTTIQKSNREDRNDENIELKQNPVQRIDIEDKKKTEMTQNGTKVAINEGIHFEDTIINETENTDNEINSDENLKHHTKNASESIENDILNQTTLGKSLTGNKQKLEQNEENLDQNKMKTGTSTDSTQEIHHENVSISDNITEGEHINAKSYEEKSDVNQTNRLVTISKNESNIPNDYSTTHSFNSAQNKCNETRDNTGKNCEKSLELIEHNNLNKAILIENSNVKQQSLTTEENDSFEIQHRSGGISDQTINKDKESKLNEIKCDKFRDEQKVSEAEITSTSTDRDLITDLKEQPSSNLTNTENETENEFDKKKNISDETNIELRQLGLIASSDNKDGVMASASNKTDEGSENISTLHEHTSSITKYVESNNSKENVSYVSTKDSGVGELDKENTRVQSKVSQVDSELEDLSALTKSNQIEKECKINDDGSITNENTSETNENTATTQQSQELIPKESLNISNHNRRDNPDSTNVTKTMENLKTSAIPTNLIMREDDFAAKDLSAARHVDDLNTIDQLELSKNEINHLEIETNNCSKTNIENNISHNESVNSQDNKLKHTEINNNEGKSNEDSSSHLNVKDNKNDEDITKIENITEKRLVPDVENEKQKIFSHQDSHEASSNTLPDDADGMRDTNDQATTLSIGNKTPKSIIGIQNFNIDRIRFYNEGLLGSISGQRFAETHLRSFWKEYLMNNSKPFGQYDNETNGIYSNQLLDSEKYEPQESKSSTYFDKNQHDEKQENTNVEPIIVKETNKDSESIPANKQNLAPTHIIKKDVERIPRYFYGALEELEDNKPVASKPKTYKEPLAFIIPIGDNNKARTAKTDDVKNLTATNSKNETHVEVLQKGLSNNFTNLDLTFCAKTEPLLEAETPPKQFEDLNQFEHWIHDVDLDITYTINEILSLRYEDDLRNNSDENDENLNDSISDYSLTPESMLQTIIELSESETPRPLEQLRSNNDNNIDLTAESNEDNSLISDELLEDENEKKSNGHTHTTGGIYEYSTNEFDNVARINDNTLHDNSHVTSPNTATSTFEEVSKEISAKKIQAACHDSNANRIFLIDSSNKKDEKIESNNGIDNTEACSENISKEEDKTIDYRYKNEPDFGPSVDLHLKDETLLDNKQIVSIIPNPPNNDSLLEDSKEIAAKKIQRVYRQHLQKTANRDNKNDFETDNTIKAHDMKLVSTTVDSFHTKFSEIESPKGLIEIDNIGNSDKTFKDERNSKEQDKKFGEFSKNSNNSDDQESEPVNSNSEMKNKNNSIESSSECYSTVTNYLKMSCNSDDENNNNQPLHKADKYYEQHNIIEKSFIRENSSITGNLQSELSVTANDRSNQRPPKFEAANDNNMQVTDTAMNTDKAAKIIQLFFKKNIKPNHKSNTNADIQKTHWFVGDEPIVANEESPPLPKTKSEISFDETEAYVELTTNLPQYLVDSNSSEDIDTNSFSRTPTAPITNQSSDSDSCSSSSSSEDSLVEKCINLPKGSVLTDDSQPAAATAPYIGIQSSGANGRAVNEKQARYTNLIDQFITSERFYSGIVNRNYSYSDIKDIQFPSSNITEITKILTEFLDSRSENLKSDIRYEILEEPCIKKTVEEEISSSGTSSSSSDIDDAEDSLGTKTVKLQKPEIAIIKMQKRRNSTSKISNLDNLKDYNFNEPSVMPIENLDTDEEGIVVARLQRDETRESTGQSEGDVVIGSTVKEEDSNLHENFNFDSTFPSKGSLKRVYTIGGEVEDKFLLKNVTIDESIKYIEPPDYELNDSSLCLDDETTANIRHKMMAYSLSEADSDLFERTADNHDSSSWELKNKKYDDFNISTALIDNGDTSTETESSTVSGVTKIQAGTRGSFNSSKVSIGNAAISESLEHLVKEAAAKRIQKMYRQHYRLKTANANNMVKSSPECTKSMETTLAQKRSIMLQRGDALRNGSSPEEATSSSNSGENENEKIISKIEKTSCIKSKTLPEQNTTSSCSLPSSAKSAAAIRAKKIEDNKRRWIAMRQNSMPVQIDSEVLRVIPKYIRKKIKSAEGEKKKDRRRMLMD